MIGHERMSAIAETLEIMGNAAAMHAIAEHKAGRTKFGNLDDIPE
jgi:antitoxin YefM